jgi:hypothetical protein
MGNILGDDKHFLYVIPSAYLSLKTKTFLITFSTCTIVLDNSEHFLNDPEVGFLSEKFPNCTSATLKARPFQK